MARRHSIEPGRWESVFGRLEELVLANSGEDEFEEILKLLVAKLYAELDGGAPFEAARVDGLIAAAAERWPGIIEGVPRSRLTDAHLAVCAEALDGVAVLDTGLEALDAAFEHLVSRASKGAKGQYFTPRHVIDCCVEIAAPGPDELVADPACGSGGFLAHALLRGASAGRLWGFDIDPRVVRVAKALMLVAGGEPGTLHGLNSLVAPALEDAVRERGGGFEGFDVVLTNPPFAGEIREPGLLSGYELHRPGRRIERDVLFLERCVRLLRPGGRLAIVLPHNKLGAPAWAYAREWLLREARVVAVLGLARNTFLPHTHQKADVVFAVRRERPRPPAGDEPILFLISERAGKDSKGRIVERDGSEPGEPAWTRASHDLGELVAAFREFVAVEGIAWGPARG